MIDMDTLSLELYQYCFGYLVSDLCFCYESVTIMCDASLANVHVLRRTDYRAEQGHGLHSASL